VTDHAHDTVTGGLSGRRPRLMPDEVRHRVLQAACDSIYTRGGLTVSMDHLNFEVVIQRANVARSAAYRIWETKDHFVVDLLRHLAGPKWGGTAAFDEAAIVTAREVVRDRLDQLDTKDGRRAVMREAIRQATEQKFAAILGSAQWRTYVALNATVNSIVDSDIRAEIQNALIEAESRFITMMAGFYEAMARVLGVRPRKPFRFEHLAAAGAAALEGSALRYLINPELVSEKFQVEGSRDDGEEWSLVAIAYLGIAESMLEDDTDYVQPPSDPRRREQWFDRQVQVPALTA
jgi:hypothetical protein